MEKAVETKKVNWFMITYKVGKVAFDYQTPYVSEAFEAIKAIITRESAVAFPNKEEAFCNYFEILSDIARGKTLSHENHIFRIDGKH